MGLDKTREFSTIHGLPGLKYEQDGKYFSADESEVVQKVEPVSVQEAIQFVHEPEPIIEPSVGPVEEVLPSYQCSKCGRTFSKNQALLIHLRSHR